ncbi:EscU/YscU/HrcU family type III secretion system export apparatus switch protein [Nocardioides sp. BP30]|uniref:EscU/YscU/HrcU family type III secretion system export apparatus switch protein n=1 Tax=Nocardioides sp. BP30 TaxID=3036374 RepID=UPI0024683A67|nr:EscU/YscU/HrcU family type III secretion system export apparatus switch protein [Nocardioides sp. BP30]WGL51971.1 EscU/YscU/HrcU family type III secretion system export apparatus switch protein [Nocardioides sp. BP30]
MAGEKTEKPTAKRRRETRKKGQVARTPEFGQWLTILVVSALVGPLLTRELRTWQDIFEASLRSISDPEPAKALDLMGSAMRHAFMAIITLGSIVLVIGVVTAVAQGGMVFAPKAAKPSLKKLDPISGFKRLFGPQTLWQGAKILLKSAVVALIGYLAIRSIMPLIGGLMPMSTVIGTVQGKAINLLRTVAVVGLVLAAADYMMAKRRMDKQMKMTKDEVKDEHKQAEGDPKVKGAIRSRQLAMARSRMINSVADADVLLVNPTHVAVALKYDPEQGAPRVIARGAGAIAARIRAKAAESQVPLVQDVPLARALYRSCEVGQEIPRELFAAVAQVLAFVISRRGHGHQGGEHTTPRTVLEALPEVPTASRRRRAERAARPARAANVPLSAAEQLLDEE